MKAIIAAGILLGCAHGAVAAPYVNIESNSARVGNDYTGTLIETHVGYEGEIGEASGYYIQAGPAFGVPDGKQATTDFSGKAGLTHQWSEKFSSYKEVYFLTGGDTSWNVKAGVTYKF